MAKYWICVTNKTNWDVVREQRVWGVTDRSRLRLWKVEPGDVLVFYVKPKTIGGIFRANSEPFESDKTIFSSTGFSRKETFPNRVRLEKVVIPEKPIAFERLVPKLGFIANKKRWGGYLMTAMLEIPKKDYEIIRSVMAKQV